MKTNFKVIIAAIIVAFAVVSCGNKGSSVDAALSRVEKAMDKVEKNKKSMTEADWQALSEDLEEHVNVLADAFESDKVSTLKKLKISAALLRHAAVLSEAAFYTLTDSLSVVADEWQDELKEVFDSDEMKQAIQEMQKAAEELRKIGQ